MFAIQALFSHDLLNNTSLVNLQDWISATIFEKWNSALPKNKSDVILNLIGNRVNICALSKKLQKDILHTLQNVCQLLVSILFSVIKSNLVWPKPHICTIIECGNTYTLRIIKWFDWHLDYIPFQWKKIR